MKFFKITLILLFVSLVFLLPSARGDQEEYILGVPPFFPSGEMEKQFSPLLKYLSQKTGAKFTLKVAASYDEVLSWLEQNRVHFAELSPYSFVQGRKKVSLHLLATVMSGGKSTYRALVVTNPKFSIHSLKDLKGKTFGFVDLRSTSGFLYPRSLLIQKGHSPSLFLGKTYFLGNHQRVIEMLLDG